MKPDDFAPYIQSLKKRHDEIRGLLSSPDIYSRPAEIKNLSRESQRIETILSLKEKLERIIKELSENKRLAAEENDPEMKTLAGQESQKAEIEKENLSKQILLLLLPQDPNDTKNIIVEIRPAAGGDEAGLFSAEMFRAYRSYAESQKWKLEVLDLTSNSTGGIKEVIFSISGENVYSRMKFESGVHRVQRVPATETSGRIHTSTITVAVMPEAEEVELQIKPSELKFDVFRSSGPGGQSVNTTDSAVRATHIPTGLSVASQQEKSQYRNKETALRILRSKLLKMKQDEEAAKQSAAKKSQIGSGGRSEKIRTYNFPQNRVTDHRFNINVFNLPEIIEGNLSLIINQAIEAEKEEKLQNLNLK
jgi:peptide chain release factor 1